MPDEQLNPSPNGTQDPVLDGGPTQSLQEELDKRDPDTAMLNSLANNDAPIGDTQDPPPGINNAQASPADPEMEALGDLDPEEVDENTVEDSRSPKAVIADSIKEKSGYCAIDVFDSGAGTIVTAALDVGRKGLIVATMSWSSNQSFITSSCFIPNGQLEKDGDLWKIK